MDEVLDYNRKTLTDVYMAEVGERTEDAENKVNFLQDQVRRNENPAVLQLEVDKIRDRGRHLKEQVDALVTEFEAKYYELKATRTEHIKKIENEYSLFLLKLKTESAKCSDVCNSGSLQEVESVIKSLDELLKHTSLPNIELREDFFEPVQTATFEMKDLFGIMCSTDILTPDKGGDLSDKPPLPDVNIGDNSDIASLLDSEHGTTPKASSVQGDIASVKSFIQSETDAKSDHGDFEDVDVKIDSMRTFGITDEIPAHETVSDKLPEIPDQDISSQSGSVHDAITSEKTTIQSKAISTNVESVSGLEISKSGKQNDAPVLKHVYTSDELEPESIAKHSSDKDKESVVRSEKSAAEDSVEEDLDVTDTSQVLEKEDVGAILQDTEDEVESEKSRYSYVSSYEDTASSKSSSFPKLKDDERIIPISKDNAVKDIEEHSLVGDADSKDEGHDSETCVKDKEIKSDHEDSQSSVDKPVKEASTPIVRSKSLGQDSPDGKPQFKSGQEQKDHSNATENVDRNAKDNDTSKAVSHSVPTIHVTQEMDTKAIQELAKSGEMLDKGASQDYPKEKVITHIKDTEVLKQKTEVSNVEPPQSTTEYRDRLEREGLRRNSIDADSEASGGSHVPSQPTHAETHDILDVLHTFKVKGGDEVISICPLSSGDCAWIARQKGKHVFRAIKMVSKFGKVLQTSGFPRAVVDISVDRSDGMLVTCTDSVIRQMLAVDKSVIKVETDEDLTSLCQLSTGNIVVCHYLTSKVVLLDPTGARLGCLDGKGRDRATVGNPWKVRVNENNDDIVIINRQGPSSIVVVDKNLNLRFLFDGTITYTASNISAFTSSASPREIASSAATTSCSNYDNRFIPVDACFDSSNNIIIAEYNRKAVLVLDAEGRLLGTLYNECTRPTSLAVDGQGHLWVGYSNGKIDIIRHLREKINWLK